MRLATFSASGKRQVGLMAAGGAAIEPLKLDQGSDAATAIRLLVAGRRLEVSGPPIPLKQVTLEAPIPRPDRNIFCVGKNYHEHAHEFARSGFDSSAQSGAVPDAPIIFSKVPETVTAPGRPILIDPRVSGAIDYEAELAVVIGRGGRGIRKADALDHVWGYTIVNDVTARDLQGRHKQWLIGKSQDSFCPMGPWLVSRDELDLADTQVRCWVNGELRQDANTNALIFDVPTLIETISAGLTLMPGDIIATGTPAGVGIGFNPPKYLKAGDVVRIEIGNIGVLENPVAELGGGGMSTQTIERMAVDLAGQGDAVIFVHGLGGSSNVFTPQVMALGSRYRTVRPDLPGSARSPVSGQISIEGLADAMIRMAGVLGIDRAHFVGHSMGTIVCQHVAANEPKLVRSLTLFGPLLAPPEPARQAMRDRAAKARAEGMADIAEAILQGATSGDTKTNNPVGAALVRELLMRQDAEGYARNCEALAAAQPADTARIGCPVLLITGDEDGVAPPSNVRAMAQQIKEARVTVLNRCGHWTTLERSAECNTALKEFLAGRA